MTEKREKYIQSQAKVNTPLFPFDFIESKISLLLIDMKVLNKHPEDFPETFRKELESNDVNVGENLTFYVVQEIQDFYRQAYKRFDGKIDFPETAIPIKEFRGEVVAHINTKSSSEIAKECIALEKMYGFERICKEWRKFKDELYSKIKSGELKL